ncbi:MAG TPA: NF038122 family metalloprotease [Blastocatellia bacterium]|nr:NF038122 family metalloprotease [Blastocatellia bacterium]
MNSLSHQFKRLLAISVMAILAAGFWPQPGRFAAQAGSNSIQGVQSWTALDESSDFIIEASDEGASCREASVEESRYFNERDPNLILRPINDFRLQDDGGLQITLRSTAQLDSFPDAKAAFLRAAARWQSLIQSPISIIIDVDFGPTRFGQAYPEGVLGSTSTQTLFNSSGYVSLRSRLIAAATDTQKSSLYNSLPSPSMATDIGSTQTMGVPSATLRMIGEIPAVANPSAEPGFGPVPSIGFNSAFAFDFDPSNGIDSDKIDFDAVATHEIGHALGFTSRVGSGLSLSVWDFFRFRPGIALDGFTNTQRVLSVGGDHVFFAGAQSLALSTGGPSGSGGDGRQASHWKDDSLSGQYIGIMDPSLGRGFRATITPNDLAVLDAMGYRINATGPPPPPEGGNNPPVINSVTGGLSGNTLTLMVNAADPDGDLAQAQVSLLDGSNNVLTQFQPVTLVNDPSPTRTLTLTVTSMNQFPAALKASVALTDSRTNRSGASTLDFSLADAGGPNMRSASYDGSSSMTIKGSFSGTLQLEINGVIVAPPLRIKVKGGGAKLKIAGAPSELNLHAGANRVRVLSNSLRSNIIVLTL